MHQFQLGYNLIDSADSYHNQFYAGRAVRASSVSCKDIFYGQQLVISGTSAAELTAGLGYYMREYCNMTIGWPRGGGSNIFIPTSWPIIGSVPVSIARVVPLSYIMNVCTHSYSLVWYDWPAWEKFIDWMALSGINMFLAMTGQEEVQYKVLMILQFDLGLMDQRF